MDGIDPAMLQRIMALLQQNGSSGMAGGPMMNSATPPPMGPSPTGMPGPGPAGLAPPMPGGQGGPLGHMMPQQGAPQDPRSMQMPGMHPGMMPGGGRPY
jgi:hypothetical protein